MSAKLSRMNRTSRRQFLSGCAAVSAAAYLSPRFSHSASVLQPAVKFPTKPIDRIAVASYPFREFIAGEEHKSGNPTMELKDFAAHVVEKFGVHHIEPWSPHFPSTDPKYLEQFRSATEKAGSSVVDIAFDSRHSVYAADPAEREQAVKVSQQWIDVALALASPSIRTHIDEAKDSKPDVARTAESLRRIADYAATKNVPVHLENDNPVSEDPFFIIQVLDKVNSPWLRALPDFGNSLAAHETDPDFNYRAIDAMFAHAYGISHVKETESTDKGTTVHVDLARTFAIAKKHGYKGYFSMEYDAPGDPYKPTAELIAQTVKYLA
jgi:sugar phosphate isomerase/epimerase